MIKNIKNNKYIDKYGDKILIINFVIVLILSLIPFLPLKLMDGLNEPAAVFFAFTVFILSKIDLILLLISVIAAIIVMSHSFIPNKTLKNYCIILFSAVAILVYITMFSLLAGC